VVQFLRPSFLPLFTEECSPLSVIASMTSAVSLGAMLESFSTRALKATDFFCVDETPVISIFVFLMTDA
jgi:Na+/pantothenate symporter